MSREDEPRVATSEGECHRILWQKGAEMWGA